VRRLRADLESAKEDLQRTHTELGAVQSEANHFSLAITGVKQDLEREGRTCKTLEAEVKELRGEPQTSTRGLTGVQCVCVCVCDEIYIYMYPLLPRRARGVMMMMSFNCSCRNQI
jgi:hypothetical protein